MREWQQDGRRYFEYKLDHPSMNIYCFVSGRYEIAREEWHGIQLEVYYLKEQPWNVPRMMNSMKKSLDYYIKNFGPYEHKEARIIEFPRVANFAQSFPGTMPYSESIGFIANLNHPDDIDTVFYVVAHEMAHQWWAHQVMGANMEGATLLSETLAQYSALMVMEKEFGRDMMRKFLCHEMDEYLRSRGQELLKERPLLTVEVQPGIHSLPKRQCGALLHEGDDRRGCRQSRLAQADSPVRLCPSTLSHVLCLGGCVARGDARLTCST